MNNNVIEATAQFQQEDMAHRVCLASAVRAAMEAYFDDLEEQEPANLHHMVMGAVERPLLQAVMAKTQGNQTHAARMLGINRSTLRKKLAQYGLNA